MLISVVVPDPIARSLRLDGPQPEQRALEMLALEGYRSGELSRGQVGEMLSLGFHETEIFLKKHEAWLDIQPDELAEDMACLRTLLSR